MPPEKQAKTDMGRKGPQMPQEINMKLVTEILPRVGHIVTVWNLWKS